MIISFFDNSQNDEPAKPLAKILAEPEGYKKIDKKNQDRKPASVENHQSGKDQKLALMLFCDSKSLHNVAHAQMLMLELTSCHQLKDKHQLWIKNETNGFKAQIFKLTAKKFKTDFIQLSPGKNIITVDGVLKDGQTIKQTLEILSAS